MRRVMSLALLAASLLGSAIAANTPSAQATGFAAGYDGGWSVLVITEKGDCDRGYRYSVNVSNGQVSYQGDADVNLSGTIAPNGLVKISIHVGDQGANGTGRLSPSSGIGTWHGIGSSSSCAGRWEAERR